MTGTRLKVIASESPETFEFEVNEFLTELDAQGLDYDLSLSNADKHCAYISFSSPKLKIPLRENARGDLCAQCCRYFDRDRYDGDAYCDFHRRKIKYGGFCCAEYYDDFGGKGGDQQ